MSDPYTTQRDFERQRDAIAIWCERVCTVLFLLTVLGLAAGIFE